MESSIPTPALASWLERISTASPSEISLGLERVDLVLERLAVPQPDLLLTVAGTNGKGSSVALLESLLRCAGYRTGAYTSPHVSVFNERIRIDGQMVSDEEIVAALATVEQARGDVPLTYFEFATLAAAWLFGQRSVQAVLLEVGLGGRLDAVNAFEPDAVLITNVTLDHCEWLGNDVESIAAEKAGVMRAGKPAVFGDTLPPSTIVSHADRLGADLRLAGRDFRWDDAGEQWNWRGRETELDSLTPPPLSGRHQLSNAAAVLATLEAAGLHRLLDRTAVNEAFAGVQPIPGRAQLLHARERRWLLDGAHNAASAEALAAILAAKERAEAVTLVLGVLDDKDADAIVSALAPRVSKWLAVAPDSPRALRAEQLARTIEQVVEGDVHVCATVPAAIDSAVALSLPDALIVVAGSFYTVGDALSALAPERAANGRG